MEFNCPTCRTIRPPYGFHANRAVVPPIGEITYITIFCSAEVERHTAPLIETSEPRPKGQCGAILGVQVVEFRPDAELEAALRRAGMRVRA
jgi:hypothetical protein